MILIHLMHNPPVTEHPNQWELIISTCYSGDTNLEILFKACNFKFACLLPTVLRCSVKSRLLSIMTPKSFSVVPFLIMIFLHLTFYIFTSRLFFPFGCFGYLSFFCSLDMICNFYHSHKKRKDKKEKSES